MRVLAMYLPQFHRVRENDEWWGEGFTDWVTVKNAKSLYEGHEQPKVPLHGRFYDLLERGTMQWQSDLMKKYGIDGMCMYHYWFKDGKKILEKPAENLLQWTDLDMPFCFCWANETWARSWSNVRDKNTWADTLEKSDTEDENGVLLEQKYGDEKQWDRHFEYLLPFFQDSRYIKMDGRPVFVIYRSGGIPCIGEMLALWRRRAAENGLEGLYIIGVWAKERIRQFLDAELYHEPVRARFATWRENTTGITRYDYEEIWGNILKAEGTGKTFYGGFVSYDDTPRRAEGNVIEGACPERFGHHLMQLMKKNEEHGNDIVFLNAWNEWGEGMYLEPDERHGYGYLEAVLHAKNHYKNWILPEQKDAGKQADRHDKGQELENILNQKDKVEHYLNLLDTWMSLRERGIRIDAWLLERNWKKIGVYGYGTLGKHFVKELESSEVQIQYLIDRRKNHLRTGFPVYRPEDRLPRADAIVVTATFYFDEIYGKLRKQGVENIISLEQVIEEI